MSHLRHTRFRLQEARKGRLDPSFGLARTHVFDHDESNINVAASFPVRTGPVTFAISVKVTGPSPDNIIFETGATGIGIAVWLQGNDLHVAAGNGAVATDDGVDASAADVINGTHKIVFAINPGDKKVKAWVDGKLVILAESVDPMTAWTGTNQGAVGQPGDVVTDRVPAPNQAALVDAEIISQLSVYMNQLPRQF